LVVPPDALVPGRFLESPVKSSAINKEGAMSKSQDLRERNRLADADVRERLLAEIPLTEHRRDLAGVSTAVLEGGDGPPVVLLHGQGEFAALWARVIPDLLTTHRVVAPDLPGHGASEMPDGRLDAGRAFAWLGELIEQTCPSPPALVGHLLGGAIAARFAANEGDRISRLVLVDSFGLGFNRPALRFALPLVTYIAHPTERTRDRFIKQCFVDFDGVREEMGERFERFGTYALAWARTKTAKTALRSLMPEFGMRGISKADLTRIAVPTTLIWGRHDLQTRLGVAEAASAQYGWPLHVIEDARNDPAFEQPEAFLHALHAALGTSTRQEAT
jgi:pimeloyl-ACP methyl ester carboxylesterase